MNHHAWLISWNGISLTFCLGWLLTLVFISSASQAAEIVSHSNQTKTSQFIKKIYLGSWI
jgi:hypothetical protein